MSTSSPNVSSAFDTERLSYRRQFYLGADYVDAAPTWARREIAGKYRLCAHPDLPVTHVETGGKSITLLGYILDPDDPAASDAKIVERLCSAFDESADVPPLTSRFGGRWVIIAHDGRQTLLFHDAAGLRQVYYSHVAARDGGGVVCASQPGLIAEVLGLAPSPEALDYVRSRGDHDSEVYWMPGDTSPYGGVRALLPNHLLRLEDGAPSRYWPTGPIERVPYARGLDETARLLRGLMDSARRRYPLAIAMTAGWDSRLMLALSREAAKSVYFYTLTYPHSSDKTRDVYIPAKLLQKLGLKHHILRYPAVVDERFKRIARRNSSAVHGAYCADAQALREAYPAERLCVTGDVAEVVKRHYRLPQQTGHDVTATDLANVCEVSSHPFAIAAFEAWLSGVAGHEHINLLDLFCWEQMAGRWHAHIRAEYDVVQESFAPLNCRSLLVTMLAVDESYRAPPDFALFRGLIEILWKDLLLVPINPREKVRWRRALVDVLSRLHLYQLVPQGAKDLAKRVLRTLR
jgi:hypothetical protein